MKAFCIMGLLLSVQVASAQTVLIGPGVRNGGFEMDNDPVTAKRAYTNTLFWYNVGTGDQSQTATLNNFVHAGARSHVVAETDVRTGGQDTGYTISSGDLFDVSYYWRGCAD